MCFRMNLSECYGVRCYGNLQLFNLVFVYSNLFTPMRCALEKKNRFINTQSDLLTPTNSDQNINLKHFYTLKFLIKPF